MRRAKKSLRLLKLHLKELSDAWEVEQEQKQEIARAFRRLEHASLVNDPKTMLKAVGQFVRAFLPEVHR